MLTWHYITQNDYNNMSADIKTSDKLFFIKDTNEIFCGTDTFKDYIIVYNTTTTTTTLLGRLYVNAYTLESVIYDSTSWINVVSPVIDTKIDTYIDNTEIGYVEYDSVSNVILVTFIDGTTDIIMMNDLILDLVYGKSTGAFAIDFISAKLLNHNEKINLDNFIDSITYDIEIKNNISINFKDKNSMDIIIDGCIEDASDDIVNISITGNEFIAECILASNEDNMIIENNSLFVVCKNNYTVITEDTDEEQISGNSEYITEVAIANIISVLQSTYSEYNFSVGSGHEGEIIVADASGIPIASGVKIGGASLMDTPTDKYVATEVAIAEYVEDNTIPVERIVNHKELASNSDDASDTDVLSEKAFIKSMQWNIL